MKRIEIKQGRIIDLATKIDQVGSLYIAQGKIVSLFSKPDNFQADQIINAKDHIVCPGFIDLSTRLRKLEQPEKATFSSETQAAASAGITSLCLPPDTSPIVDTPAIAELIKDKALKVNYPNIYPLGALTQGLIGKRLSAMQALKASGCIGVSNVNKPLASLAILRRAMEYATDHCLTLFYHPDEASLSDNGCVHEGILSTQYGLSGIPAVAESIAVAQCLELAELTTCRVHFSQISCKRAMIKIQQAKQYGLNVTADVAIHQLHLSEKDIEPFNSAYHVLPPLRSEADKLYLQASIADGTLDSICSHHQPHNLAAKLDVFSETEPGLSSLETLLPLTLKLVKNNCLSLANALACLNSKPATILGLPTGVLKVGYDADICIFDLNKTWEVNNKNWLSAGKNTPFWGQFLTGRVTHTLQKGQLIYPLKQGS
jgi:dihydroorotase